MLVVADTSALIALCACDSLGVLDRIFEEVRVPRQVFRECLVRGKPLARQLETYLDGKVVDTTLDDKSADGAVLGRGELEAMALYLEIAADWLLLDDRRARKAAVEKGIQVVGSLGVLVRAKELGLVPTVQPLIARIEAAGIHLGEQLVTQALDLAGEGT